MKFKRFMFKVLRLKVIIPALIVIALVIILLCYLFSGVKASALNTNEFNLPFDFSAFKSYEDAEKDFGLAENEIGTDKYYQNIEAGMYKKWLAQNDNYVMYFDYATTIAYVYQITPESKDGTKEPEHTQYDHIDITKCPIVYTTAKEIVDKKPSADGGNFVVSYADSNTGKTVSSEYNTMTNSVFYKNPLTEETEHHYFLKEVENGIQIFYAVGEFSAGNDYFPQKFYQTIYKPYNGEVLNDDDEPIEKSYYMDTEGYDVAMEYWVKYMKMLGLEDPENATDKEINEVLYATYEQRFRGNAYFNMYTKKFEMQEKYDWHYTGSVIVYTEAGYEYMLKLRDEGKITFDDEITFKYDELKTASKYFKYGNATWEFKNVACTDSSDFFSDGEGVYYNCESSPIIVNTAIPAAFFKAELGYGSGTLYQTTTDEKDPFIYYIRNSVNTPAARANLFKMLYTNDHIWQDSVYKFKYINSDTNDTMSCGGILKFEDGHFVYGSDGKIEKTVYSLDLVAEDNERFGIDTNTVLPVFGLGAELKLTKNGLQTTIIAGSLIDSSNANEFNDVVINIAGVPKKIGEINSKYQMLTLTILPQMTTSISKLNEKANGAVNGEDGYLLIPDGSGAIITFANGKYELGYEGVNKAYYGSDNAFATKAQPEDTKDLMLGMFGYVCKTAGRERGVLGIIEQGGSQNSLLATTDQFKNCAYFKLAVRKNQEVKIGTGSGARPFYKLAKKMADIDGKYLYMFLNKDQLEYSTIAQLYQDYLIERDFGDSYEPKDTTRNTVVDLNFLGSFEKYALFLGFKGKVADSLTTFDQAEEIISELKNGIEVDGSTKKIQDYSVSYTAWTSEEMEYDVGGRIKVNSVLGGLKSMKDFVNFLNTDGKSLYLETKVTSTKDFDYAFGKLKFDARNVSNNTASVYDYNPSTLRQDKKLSETNYINPMYFINITNYVLGKMEKINKNTASQTGYYLNDLGNSTTNSFKTNEEVYGENSIQYQKESLRLLKESGGKVKVEAPYDYAFKYVDEATNIPLTSTLAPIYDETIPFYQLVISGLFDYTTEDINGTSNNSAKWFYSKAIETGSNLSFVISAENPNILLDTDYTFYYQAYYQNWKENIVKFASDIDSIGIHQGKLVYHAAIGKNISFVQYKLYDGSGYINLCVNTTESDYTVPKDLTFNGISIPANTVIPGYGYNKIA